MYAPGPFQEPRTDVLLEAIGASQLATLVTPAEGELHITHVPMIAVADASGELRLEAHLARRNPHYRVLATRPPSVAIFHGPQAYVSPGWYASKAEHGKVVPTWNYIVVHAHGVLEAIDDAVWLEDQTRRLTDRNEGGRAQPWSVDDAPRDYFESMLRGIVGIKLTVSKLEGVWKLQQHRSDADRAGLIAGYASEADPAARKVGEVMSALEQTRR
jgi:transcriptional regulator